MKIWSIATAVALVALSTSCGDVKQTPTDDFSSFDAVAEKADVPSSWRLVGSLSYGQKSASVSYTSSPRYRAFKFAGQQGDKVTVWVRSSNGGDALTWLLNDSFRTLAFNDDASS